MRRSVSRSANSRRFKNLSGYTKAINISPRVMRGGFRL